MAKAMYGLCAMKAIASAVPANMNQIALRMGEKPVASDQWPVVSSPDTLSSNGNDDCSIG